jgi:hypothetical protein
VPSLALSASSQTLAVADGGTINQGNDLVLDAQVNNPPGQYEVFWHEVTASQALVRLGRGLPFTHQPSFDTHYRAQLMSGGQVLATADFNVLVEASPSYGLLRVVQPGGGRGLVVSEPAGINCGIGDTDSSANCRHTFQLGNRMTLSVDAADIGRFQRWEGCDQVEDNLATGDRCVVVMDGTRNVNAHFSARSDYVLEFTSVDPDGRVSAYNMDNDYLSVIDCSHLQGGVTGTCRAQLPNGTGIRLAGYRDKPFAAFVQWGGDCAEFNSSGDHVLFNINRDYYCTAEFTPDTHIHFNYTVAGNTTQVPNPLSIGSVQTNPAGQACYVGVDGCYGYPQGTGQVQVTAVPDTTDHPWLFHIWDGACADEVFNRFRNMHAIEARSITLDMQQDYATCEARFRTDVTRAVIDFSHPGIANIREINHNTNAPSIDTRNVCSDDCELVKTYEANFNGIMDLVVEIVDTRWQFDGWEGCDSAFVSNVPEWGTEQACRIGLNGYGVFNLRANFSPKNLTPIGGSN